MLASIARADNVLFRLLQDEVTDKGICLSKFTLAVDRSLASRPIGEVVAEIGSSFVGTRYVAHTLEQPGEEHLVVNLQGFDCVSFYENSLCLARCVKKGTLTFEAFKEQLQWIRYRSGIIDGYPSRLHYTSDYFYDNVKKGVVRDMTRKLGGVEFPKTVGFMSSHPEAYPKLKNNPEFIEMIRKQEETINRRTTWYLPKDKVGAVMSKIKDGDIIGTTTSMEGLDTSHTGIALWQDGQVHFMHAPLAGGAVEISKGNLAEYLQGNSKQTGIMIVRPQEPA
jgi:hypothetical protein